MKYYLVGIKGSGMAALAHILYDDGHTIQGMDTDQDVFTEKMLMAKDISIDSLSFRNFGWVDLFIIGHNFMHSAVHQYLMDHHYKWMEYHDFVSYYASHKTAIAVSGTHGKTTTVGMLALTLQSFVPTSMLRGDGVGCGGLEKEYFVFEACEYKNHFHRYHPDTILLTNIDYDHTDFFPNVKEYEKSFNEYVKNAKEVYINYEDRHKISHDHVVTYGIDARADYACVDAVQEERGIKGTLQFQQQSFSFFLPFFGEHNLMHALAVFAYCHEHGFNLQKANEALAKFSGVKRRMMQKIINDDVFIDDYAHHPKEIEATLKAVRLMYPSRKVIVFFKPDRYSRLISFQEDFIHALHQADQSYVLPLYEDSNGCHDSHMLCLDDTIRYLADEKDLQDEKFNENKMIFLFMSSKKMDNWIDMIVKKRESKY